MATALISLLLLLAGQAFAGDVVIGQFSGLNTQDASVTLADSEAQDLLNVDITPGGKSVKKRGGYGLHKNLEVSTSAVHGAHYFQDINGSDVQLWGHDKFLNASVNGGSIVRVATGTHAATWQCTDSVGYAYCATSARDMIVRTAGTAATASSYLSGAPLGTMVTVTPDRLVVAGVSGNESTLYFSQANTFTNFTTGVLDSSPFTEVINAPGSRITHIKYACGKLLWWKDQSFGYSVGNTQYNLENVTISNNIGTLDNSSDEYNGNVYFRGQDSHIYRYDCANVTRLSRAITPTVQSANRRRANSWSQDSQSDFQSGASIPTPDLSFTINPGAVVLSTGTTTYTNTSDFSLGVTSNTEVFNGSVRISTNNVNVPNNGFESAYTANDWTDEIEGERLNSGSVAMDNCSLAPRTGSYLLRGGYSISSAWTLRARAIDYSGNVLATTDIPFASNSCTYTARTLNMSGQARKSFLIQFSRVGGNALATSVYYLSSGEDITFYTASDYDSITGSSYIYIDDVENGRSTVNLGWYRTPSFDTGMTQSVLSVSVSSSVTAAPLTYSYQSSADNSTWGSLTQPITNQTVDRYVRFVSTWTRTDFTGNGLNTTIDALTYSFTRSSGSYRSAVNQATSLTSWDTLSSDFQLNGGTITFYVRASTGSFTVLSSTPNWYTQSVNATVNYATGTYMQMRADFGVTSATQTPTINDFTFNWFEGSASDKAYIKYWNDYVWIAVSSGTSGLNNRIFRWDVLNETWLLDDIASNGFLVDNNRLFFGSPSYGKAYVYDNSLRTDDSGNINSYWKSKDFTGTDPFLQNTWDQADFIVRVASGTTLTATYSLDVTSSTAISLNLYDPVHPNATVMRKGNNLNGQLGTFMNVKVGDNSSNDPWEVMSIRFKYSPQPWRPK